MLKHTFYLVCLLCCLLGGGCRKDAPEPSAAEDSRPARIRKLEQAIVNNDDPDLTTHDRLWEQLKAELTLRLALRVRNAVYDAAEIYICPELTGEFGLRCRYLYADDTIHQAEFPETYLPVPFPIPCAREDEGIQVEIAPELANEKLVWYLGEPRIMHANGYRDIQRVPLREDGQLALEPAADGRSYVLFTIVKAKDELLYKKYVWVLGQ